MANSVPDQQTAFIGKDKDLMDKIYSFKRMRQSYEPQAYLSRRAYEGKHFVYWDKVDQKLTELPSKKQFFNQIPEIAKQTDAFENFLISTNLVFTVIPSYLSDNDALTSSQRLSMLAKTYYDRLNGSTVYSDFVHFAMLDNVSFIEITPNDQKDDVIYRHFDFFDILFNPTIHDWNQQRLVVKIAKRRIPELKESKLYHLPPDYKGFNLSNFKSWKDIYEQEKYSQMATMASDETLLFECYILDEKNGLTIRTIDGGANVLRDDSYPHIKGIPIRPLRIYSGEWYQPSYVYRQVPLNRSIDTIANRFEDLVLRLSKGGWLSQVDENIVGGMNEEIGQMITYEATKPEQIQMPTIPTFLMEWFSSLMSLSERYGLSSVFSGGLPAKSSGLRAGKMIDQLTGLTLQNNTATINNLRNTVKEILEFTFQFLYQMWDTPQDVITTDMNPFQQQQKPQPAFISDKAKNLFTPEAQQNMIGIPANFKRFQVEIDNGMGYTLDERKNTALQLLGVRDENNKPILSGDVVRRMFKLGSSGYMMEAQQTSILDTPEFQQLLANLPNMSPVQQQAVSIVLKTIGMMNPGEDVTPGLMQNAPQVPPPNGQMPASNQPQPNPTANGVKPPTGIPS